MRSLLLKYSLQMTLKHDFIHQNRKGNHAKCHFKRETLKLVLKLNAVLAFNDKLYIHHKRQVKSVLAFNNLVFKMKKKDFSSNPDFNQECVVMNGKFRRKIEAMINKVLKNNLKFEGINIIVLVRINRFTSQDNAEKMYELNLLNLGRFLQQGTDNLLCRIAEVNRNDILSFNVPSSLEENDTSLILVTLRNESKEHFEFLACADFRLKDSFLVQENQLQVIKASSKKINSCFKQYC